MFPDKQNLKRICHKQICPMRNTSVFQAEMKGDRKVKITGQGSHTGRHRRQYQCL